MSHYTPMHARDGQRRDAIAAWWRRKAARALTRLGGLCRFLPDRPAARLVLLALIALDRIDTTTPGAPTAAGGTRQDPALGRAPEAGATTTPSGGAAAPPRTGPASPVAPGPGRRAPEWPRDGQHPYAQSWEILTDAAAWNTRDKRVEELGWRGKARETGGMPALVRPGRRRHEAWQDGAVNAL